MAPDSPFGSLFRGSGAIAIRRVTYRTDARLWAARQRRRGLRCRQGGCACRDVPGTGPAAERDRGGGAPRCAGRPPRTRPAVERIVVHINGRQAASVRQLASVRFPGCDSPIGDAEHLAWKLAMVVNGTAEPALLDTYQAERRPVAAKAVRSTGAASNLVLGNHLVARLLRDRVVVPLMNRASVQRRVWEYLSQLKVTYRNGPLGRRARVVLRPGSAARRPGTGPRVRPGRRRRADHPACRARRQVGAGHAGWDGRRRARRRRGQAPRPGDRGAWGPARPGP